MAIELRWAPLLFLAAVTACQNDAPVGAKPGTLSARTAEDPPMTPTTPRVTFQAWADQHQRGQLFAAPFEVSVWVRGGDPGDDYVSDQLVVSVAKGGSARGQYTRARFDLAYEPPYLAEEWSGTLTPDEVGSLLQETFRSSLFSTDFPSEKAPNMGDLLKETWTFTAGGDSLTKTFFERFPAELGLTREAVKKLEEVLQARGSRRVLNRLRGEK
jgi:hypothetical protein